eukprot:TRINITY_DN1123_c0_g2_i1.p1 TRINITY_DN1123_c0_g2~~TRINITY_DN1123_c0_g2_i1.p1  ORF type:complete len:344 (+),score=146.06 TRINITY_DN1123_c0_g2_i1:137-1168(+)
MAIRRTARRLCSVLIQPMYYAADPNSDVQGFRKAGRGNAGAQMGTSAAPASQRPSMYDGPVNLPYWHHVADVWRPKQKDMAIPGEHVCGVEGDFATTPELLAVRPLLEDMIRHRNLDNGPIVAMERWEGVKKGYEAGIFDKACLHRAGFYLLDVLAAHKDMDGGEIVYEELHETVEKGGLALPFDATHLEKMMLLCYGTENFVKGTGYFEEAIYRGAEAAIKTQTFALAMACYGRELEAKRGLDLWDKWVFLERDVHAFPYYQLAELLMGCVDDEDIARGKLVLRNFNDLYIEKVFGACQRSGMDNNAMVYYAEWLFKSRRHTMLNPATNLHFLRYALHRIKA